VFGDITRSPGDTTPFVPLLINRTVPSIQHICGEIFRLFKKNRLTCQSVGFQILTHQPHLVIIHVLDTVHPGFSPRSATVNTIYRPLVRPGIGGKGKGAEIIRCLIIQIEQAIRVTVEMLIVERAVARLFRGFKAVKDCIDGLDGTGVHPDASLLIRADTVERIVKAGHPVFGEMVHKSVVGYLHGT